MFKLIYKLSCSFFKSYRLCNINAQTIFLVFCQYILTTKSLLTTLTKILFFILCFVKYKSMKIFGNVTCFHQLSNKFIEFSNFWSEMWIGKTILFPRPNTLTQMLFFFFSLAKIFLSHRKFNYIKIKIINKLFIGWPDFFGCLFMGLICVVWHHKNIFDRCFWCWLVLFLEFSIQQVLLHNNFQIMVYNLKCWYI